MAGLWWPKWLLICICFSEHGVPDYPVIPFSVCVWGPLWRTSSRHLLGRSIWRTFSVWTWHKPDKRVKCHAYGHIAQYTIGTVVTVRFRGYILICLNFIEWPQPPTLRPVPHDIIWFLKYIYHSVHVPHHLEDAGIVFLTVTYVAGVGGGAICTLFTNPSATLEFLAVICTHGDIIAQNRKIFVLYIFSTIFHVYQGCRVPSLLKCYALAYIGVHICHT